MEIYKELFDTIAEFRKMRPWEWMTNEDIFAVEHPATKQLGYCCVMGEGGINFGLAVYLETEGWKWLLERLSDIPVNSFSQFMQKSISVTFEDAKEQEAMDKNLFHNLGLTFSGKKSFPLLRRYSPGYPPEMPDEHDAGFLKTALEQVMIAAPFFKHDQEFRNRLINEFMVRKLDAANEWISEWLPEPPEFKFPEENIAQPILNKIKNLGMLPVDKRAEWIAGMFFLPSPVKSETAGGIIFPLAIVILDSDNGKILKMHLAEYSRYQTEFISLYADAVKDAGYFPAVIVTNLDEIVNLIYKYQNLIKAELDHTESIMELEILEEELIKSFQKQGKRKR